MLKNSKISQYKIKKILQFFVDDYPASLTAKSMRLNRHTIYRFYNIFRKHIKVIYAELLMDKANDAQYIGYTKSYYGPKKYVDLYKYDKKLFSIFTLEYQPGHKKIATDDEDFTKVLSYFYKRALKFYGFASENYNYQVLETIIRHYYTPTELYQDIYRRIKKTV